MSEGRARMQLAEARPPDGVRRRGGGPKCPLLLPAAGEARGHQGDQGDGAPASSLHRETFILSVYHECTHEEIAHTLNIEIGTVKSRLSRARAIVRERLIAEGMAG